MKKLLASMCILALIFMVPHVYAELTNLSLNSETTATANQVDETNSNFASNAIDGDLDTLWRATSHGTPTDPKYLIVDLGDIFEVSQIVLWGHDTGYVNYYIEYNLYNSDDGINFNFLFTGKLITSPPSTPPDQYYDYFMDTVHLPAELSLMRFAKFEVIGGPHDAHLNEIEIWGEQTSCQEPCPEDSMAPSGAVHAYPNVIWPPNNKMVTVTLEGRVMDEMCIAREGVDHGVSSAYLLIDGTDKIILLDDTMDLLNEDGHFSIETKVKAAKGSEYMIELYGTDKNTDGYNSGLVDTTYIQVPHNMN